MIVFIVITRVAGGKVKVRVLHGGQLGVAVRVATMFVMSWFICAYTINSCNNT